MFRDEKRMRDTERERGVIEGSKMGRQEYRMGRDGRGRDRKLNEKDRDY